MAKKFYFQVMGETFGPMTGVELRDRALSGDVSADTLVRIDEGDWVLAGRLTNLFDDRGRAVPHEVIQGVIPEYSDYLREHQARNDQRGLPQQLMASDNETPLPKSRYRVLVFYGRVCETFGIFGIVLTIFLAINFAWSQLGAGDEAFSLAQVRQVIVACGGLLLTSLVVAAFGRLVLALVDLVRHMRRNNELLEHSLRNQERLMIRAEQRREG